MQNGRFSSFKTHITLRLNSSAKFNRKFPPLFYVYYEHANVALAEQNTHINRCNNTENIQFTCKYLLSVTDILNLVARWHFLSVKRPTSLNFYLYFNIHSR